MADDGAPDMDRAIAAALDGFPQVAAAWLFGSQARGEARPDSDVDVGLLLRARHKTVADEYRLLGSIAAEIERALDGRCVDVVLLEPQGPIFCHHVLSEGRLVYDADPERRWDFESETYVRYFDFLPTHELAKKASLGGFREWLDKRHDSR